MKSYRKHALGVAFGAAMVFAAAIQAADGVTVTSSMRSVSERGAVNSLIVSVGGQRVSLIVPPGWQSGVNSAQDCLVLQSPDFGTRVAIGLADESQSASSSQSSAGKSGKAANLAGSADWQQKLQNLKDQLVSKAGRAQVQREFAWPTRLGDAGAIDLEQVAAGNLRLTTRTLYLPRQSEVLEIQITCVPGKLEAGEKALRNLLASLRPE